MQSVVRMLRFWPALVSWMGFAAFAADPTSTAERPTAPPSDAVLASARLRVAPGLKVSLWAAEPMVQNLTSLAFDEQGRAYCVETGRRRTSVFDIRGFREWLDDDYALRTVEQRAEFLRGMLNTNVSFRAAASKGGRGNLKDFNGDGVIDARDLEVESERIRRVWDAAGTGRADHAETFADGFTNIVSGVAAGILARGTNVWFTSIPDLWRFPVGGPGLAPTPTAPGRRLLQGFGVHIAFGGHDLHGLILGPDGRLYFSIADRGSHVISQEGGVFDYPDTGAVFRCEPDGSKFEVYAYGFRNPQELAFDADGQLWTADNNGDGGDKARLLPVIAGADHGWQIGWQWLPKMGAWNSERLWHRATTNSAMYLVPAVAHVGHGPAGFAFYPGTGLGAAYENHFFLADFPGGVRTFAVVPSGAGWEIHQPGAWQEDNSVANFTGKLLWDLSPVDVTFPPFGGVMVADWVEGWDKTGKGRIWHVTDPALAGDARITETRRLLGEGMQQRPVDELLRLLNQPDLRVRQEAHFALGERATGAQLLDALGTLTNGGARLHALWALDIAVRRGRIDATGQGRVLSLLKDPAVAVRMNAARLLGEWHLPAAVPGLLRALGDTDARVQAATWVALGNLQATVPDTAFAAVTGRDPFLFQAVVGYLQRLGGAEMLASFVHHKNVNVRLAAVVALRRMHSERLADFLGDPDPQVTLEVVRAIHDLPLPGLLARVTTWMEQRSMTPEIWRSGLPFTQPEWELWVGRRAVNAALLLGGDENAHRIARWASNPDLTPELRTEACEALEEWSHPLRRDRIVGLSHPKPAHAPEPAVVALRGIWAGLTNTTTAPPVLVAALRAAQTLELPEMSASLVALSQHPDGMVRAEVGRQLRLRQPMNLAVVTQRLASGTPQDQQAAFAALGDLPEAAAVPLLQPWLDQLLTDQAPVRLRADILQAAAHFPGLKPFLTRWTNSLRTNDVLAPYRAALAGGDAARGRRIFAERADLGCQRCHKLQGEGGEVGPELTGIGRRLGREYVLRALVVPDAEIAAGFESILVTLKSGDSIAGVVKSGGPDQVILDVPGVGRQTFAVSEIVARERSPSPMPAGLVELLTLFELRDLMEALAE